MIQIKTVNSRIYKGDGATLLDGHLTVTPSEPFEYTDASSPTKRKVGMEPISVPISDGQVNAFNIAPNIGASQDKQDLYYVARFYSDSEGADWTEYWQIDGAGASELEITEITRVEVDVSDVADPTLDADDVTATPGASKVPRADGSGKLAAGWLPSLTAGYAVTYFQSTEPSPSPGALDLAFWFDTSINQAKAWDGVTWRAFA